jgi:hypothetical protein
LCSTLRPPSASCTRTSPPPRTTRCGAGGAQTGPPWHRRRGRGRGRGGRRGECTNARGAGHRGTPRTTQMRGRGASTVSGLSRGQSRRGRAREGRRKAARAPRLYVALEWVRGAACDHHCMSTVVRRTASVSVNLSRYLRSRAFTPGILPRHCIAIESEISDSRSEVDSFTRQAGRQAKAAALFAASAGAALTITRSEQGDILRQVRQSDETRSRKRAQAQGEERDTYMYDELRYHVFWIGRLRK